MYLVVIKFARAKTLAANVFLPTAAPPTTNGPPNLFPSITRIDLQRLGLITQPLQFLDLRATPLVGKGSFVSALLQSLYLTPTLLEPQQ